MARFASEAELKAFLGKLDADYSQFASALWQNGVKTAHQLANARESIMLSCGLPELYIDDIKARADTTGGSDDMLSKVLTTLIELKALLPALMMMSNPFQSASSLTSKQAEAQASDFKARLLHYYFWIPLPPGLQLPQPQAQPKLQCMVSRLHLESKLIEAAHILPKASAQAYHANKIVVMYQPSTGTFRFRVLIESLMCKRLSELGKSSQARDCSDLQKHTFGEYDDTDLLLPSGNMPFRRSLAIHAAMAVAAQRPHMRSSLSFRAEDFDVVSDYAE